MARPWGCAEFVTPGLRNIRHFPFSKHAEPNASFGPPVLRPFFGIGDNSTTVALSHFPFSLLAKRFGVHRAGIIPSFTKGLRRFICIN